MDNKKNRAVLLLACRDKIGLVSRISGFLSKRRANIIALDENVHPAEQFFSIRVEWETANPHITEDELRESFRPLAEEFDSTWNIKLSNRKLKVAVFVSKYDHCLQEILWRYNLGEFPVNINMIVSNHTDLSRLAENHKIPFHHFPVDKSNKKVQEKKQIDLLNENDIDTVVLARYMQILSSDFVNGFPDRIINIHHSFLPAFSGGNPYRQAYERGVKIIGATSHYVTEVLDDGPIIEQDITRISHRDNIDQLIRKGRDLERIVLARALHLHFEHRILVKDKKTIIFE